MPPEGVLQAPGRRIGHGIDGEIPPGQILAEIRDKFHPVRVAIVGVCPFLPEGGDLYDAKVRHDPHRSVLLSGQHQGVVPEQGLHLAGGRGAAQVKVVGCLPQQAIPDAAAHAVDLLTGGFQDLHAPTHRRRDQHVFSSSRKDSTKQAQPIMV